MHGKWTAAAFAAASFFLATGSARAFDVGLPATDPAQDRPRAVAELVVGPAPGGFAPLIPPASGLLVHAASFEGTFARDARATGISFQAGLVAAGNALEPGLFLGTGSPEDAQPPDDAPDTGSALGQSRSDALAEVVSGIDWSFDAQRLAIDFTALPGTNSLRFRFVFGTEEYREYVGSQYNDAFGVFLFEDGETGPVGGAFWQSPPSYRDLAGAGSIYFLTADQIDFLRAHQIAFDASGAPITVNGPFFSGQNVVVPPANELEYDGSTRILETVAPLAAGVRYTVYIVIADTNDRIYDSGVFIASLGGSAAVETGPSTGIVPGGTGGGTTTGGSPSGGTSTGGGAATGTSGSTTGTAPPIGGSTAGGTPSSGGAATAGGAAAMRRSGSGSCAAGAPPPSAAASTLTVLAAAAAGFACARFRSGPGGRNRPLSRGLAREGGRW